MPCMNVSLLWTTDAAAVANLPTLCSFDGENPVTSCSGWGWVACSS